jgi:hypothetical protein
LSLAHEALSVHAPGLKKPPLSRPSMLHPLCLSLSVFPTFLSYPSFLPLFSLSLLPHSAFPPQTSLLFAAPVPHLVGHPDDALELNGSELAGADCAPHSRRRRLFQPPRLFVCRFVRAFFSFLPLHLTLSTAVWVVVGRIFGLESEDSSLLPIFERERKDSSLLKTCFSAKTIFCRSKK